MFAAMQNASVNFYKAIRDTYEPNWQGYEDIVSAVDVSLPKLINIWKDDKSKNRKQCNEKE